MDRRQFLAGSAGTAALVAVGKAPTWGRLAREADRLAALRDRVRAKRSGTQPRDPVTLSESAGITPDPWQAAVLRSTSSQLLLNCSRQSGKSTTAATLAVHTALYEPASLTLMLSPSLRQSGELFRKALAVYRASGKPVGSQSETALSLTLANDSRIVSLPGKEGTIRGYSKVRRLIIDEAAWVPDELYGSVRPMLAVSQGGIIAMSTPHGTRGWWYDEWENGGGAWERQQVTAYECPRIAPEFLERERERGEWFFEQEYLCVFHDADTAAFRESDIQAAFVEEFPQWSL